MGQVKTAERIVGADKLLKLTVDIGSEIRQICAGIAQYYEPESLIGRKVVVVVNLASAQAPRCRVQRHDRGRLGWSGRSPCPRGIPRGRGGWGEVEVVTGSKDLPLCRT